VILAAGKCIRRISAGKCKFDETLASVLRGVITYGVIIICAIMILDNFGFNTTSLIALLGAAGVAVGLALKDTLGNIAAGIFLLFLRPFRKGDFIEFGSFAGSVQEISLFATILETGDGVLISAPNSVLWGVPLKNYSRITRRRIDLQVLIPPEDSIETAFQILREISGRENRFLREPPPQMVVQSLGEPGITIVLRAWAASDIYWKVYSDVRRDIKEKMEAAGLHAAFPQGELRILNP
jgi:small conductance mechanosensitive channel